MRKTGLGEIGKGRALWRGRTRGKAKGIIEGEEGVEEGCKEGEERRGGGRRARGGKWFG